jgi:hypothetical protein
MKRLLGIVVLGLLLSGNAHTEILDLEKGVKVKIFNNYEYWEAPHRAYTKMNMGDAGVSASELNQLFEDQEAIGFTGEEKTKIIGKKGIKTLGKAEIMRLEGKDISNTKFVSKINKCSQTSKSEKSFIKCFYKEINGDPMFQITVAYNKIDDFKLLSESLSANPSEKKKNEIKKDFLFKNQKLFKDSFVKTSANTKLVIFDDNRWLIYVYGTQNILGLKMNIKSFLVTVNDHTVLLTSWCLSAKTCKTIKKQMASIIEPSFPITVNDLKKIK